VTPSERDLIQSGDSSRSLGQTVKRFLFHPEGAAKLVTLYNSMFYVERIICECDARDFPSGRRVTRVAASAEIIELLSKVSS
jgi:hypothetical protein